MPFDPFFIYLTIGQKQNKSHKDFQASKNYPYILLESYKYEKALKKRSREIYLGRL